MRGINDSLVEQFHAMQRSLSLTMQSSSQARSMFLLQLLQHEIFCEQADRGFVPPDQRCWPDPNSLDFDAPGDSDNGRTSEDGEGSVDEDDEGGDFDFAGAAEMAGDGATAETSVGAMPSPQPEQHEAATSGAVVTDGALDDADGIDDKSDDSAHESDGSVGESDSEEEDLDECRFFDALDS